MTSSWPNARLVYITDQSIPRRARHHRRAQQFIRSAAVTQSEEASSEQASTSKSTIDWDAFDAHQRKVPKLSHAEEARLLLDSGRYEYLDLQNHQSP